MNTHTKLLNKILANRIQPYLKGSHWMIKWDLFQGCRAGSTSTNQSMWYITLTKWRMKILPASQWMQKTFESFKIHLWWKLYREGIERMYYNIIKAINDKPTINIIVNGEKLDAFPLRSGVSGSKNLQPENGWPVTFFTTFVNFPIKYCGKLFHFFISSSISFISFL